jgi:dipeptidyl aminopeptidase/acylaminoacyl peptidase
MCKARIATAIAALLIGANALSAPEQESAAKRVLIPAEDFARRPAFDQLSFAPDGKHYAALGQLDGRMNIVVGDAEKNAVRFITSFEGNDVGGFTWIGNNRLIFSLVDFKRGLADQYGGGMLAVDADGTNFRRLSPTVQECMDALNLRCRRMVLRARIPGSEDEIIVVSNERSSESSDLYRLNTRTGKRTLLTFENPGHVARWVLDKDRVPRAALSWERDEQQRVFWYRNSGASPWRKIAGFPLWGVGYEPLGFSPDGTLYVASSIANGDKAEVYKFDPVSGKPGEKVASHPLVDLDDAALAFDPESDELVGMRIASDKPEVVWFEEKRARLQRTMDVSLPAGNANTLRKLPGGKAVVYSRSGSDPGAYYLFDEAKKELRELARPRAWIRPEQMGTVQVIRYKARDGMEIPAYLTLPTGKAAKNLPLVAWIHGGPQARDDWGWSMEPQFLASRGYAVIQPNYRGSTGFGVKHLMAGAKQWGQKMQDDVTDGIKHLVAQGIVDPNRVCIGGGSYGGYATLAGLVREPDLFKCGIDVVGVSDLVWMHELGYSDFNQFDPKGTELFLNTFLGSLQADRAMLEANSPRLHADRIAAPVLFIHGGNDVRVPIKHAEGMRDALQKAGKPYEWIVFPEEGHGFMKESNRVAYLKAMEAFLAKHLGVD